MIPMQVTATEADFVKNMNAQSVLFIPRREMIAVLSE